MTQRVLITGATGFVGRQVLRRILEKDVLVTAVVRAGSEQRLEVHQKIVSVITSVDIFSENADWWANACQSIDIIIHCAWYSEPGKYLQAAVNLDCLRGTLDLAKGAAEAKVRRLVGIGTCVEYDVSFGDLSVVTPLRPLTAYAGAKAAAYLSLSQWLPTQSIAFAWCRLFYLYGDGEDERRLVPYLRNKLAAGEIAELTSGNQIRDFMDVQDAGRMIAEVSLSNEVGPFNICSGISVSVRQLAESVADEYGRRDLLSFGSRPENLMDPPRVVGVLGRL
jgi:dTDP-6-deoxy-L-talose 4-dehydrogenase (NAD+)